MKTNREVKKICLSLLGLLFVATCVWSQDKANQLNPIARLAVTRNNFKPVVETYTFDQLGWNTGNQLIGARAEKTFYLSIPQQWQLKQAKLHLIISHSALLQMNSSLTVAVNQTPVASLKLIPENSVPTAWNIELPLEALNSEWVALKFIGFMHSDAKRSSSYDNPGNWLYISPNSKVEFSYQLMPFIPDLTKFPYPFISSQTLKTSKTLMVLPNSLTAVELIPALQIANALGFQSALKGINLSTKYIHELTDTDKVSNHLILVGKITKLLPVTETISFWPLKLGEDKFLTKNNTHIPADTGVIMLTASPWNNTRAALAVTGVNDLAVEKAADMFAQPLTIFNQKNYVLAANEANFDVTKKPLNWHEVTLKTLGYSDQTVLGLGQNTLSYTFNLPFNQAPVSFEMKIKLSHSPVTSSSYSVLNLMVNGTPQASLTLDKTNENKGIWNVRVSAATLVPGKNTIELVYDLHSSQEASGAPAYFQGWGVIFSDSSLHIQLSDVMSEASLNQFPVPFDTKTLVVIPTQLNNSEALELLQFFRKLGNMLEQPIQSSGIVTAESLSRSKLKKQNAILIGDIKHNPWIAKAFKVSEISDNSKNTQNPILQKWGVIKLMNSPWNSKRKVMVITGSDREMVNVTVNLLVDDTLRAKLKGNFIKIDKDKTIIVLDTHGQKTAVQEIHSFIVKHYAFLIVSFFILLTLACFFISYYLRHKK